LLSKKPIVALMYDFDKTLCTKDMQEYAFIPKLQMTPEAFWKESSDLAKKKKMDSILAYMWLMLDESHTHHISIHRSDFVEQGKALQLYPGVESWFDRISRFGSDLGLEVKHYIISSGLREIIEGSSIYKKFSEVFACEFYYDENDIACWPKNAVNYTTKTQFLFRINKGITDLSDDNSLNKYTPDDERVIPFRNMIYIGDGLTDVPCMKLVKVNGGYSIAVHKPNEEQKVEELILHQRVDFIALADYSAGLELEQIVRYMLCKMAIVDSLKRQSQKQIDAINKRLDFNKTHKLYKDVMESLLNGKKI
jgi:2-hydroxy-3-keto-5-methylthiopentenyl-1-phosphate phosphatase